MTEWLCETRSPHLWRAPGTPGRIGRLHFGETIAQHVASLTQSHVFLREPSQRSVTVMRLEPARPSRALSLLSVRSRNRIG